MVSYDYETMRKRFETLRDTIDQSVREDLSHKSVSELTQILKDSGHTKRPRRKCDKIDMIMKGVKDDHVFDKKLSRDLPYYAARQITPDKIIDCVSKNMSISTEELEDMVMRMFQNPKFQPEWITEYPYRCFPFIEIAFKKKWRNPPYWVSCYGEDTYEDGELPAWRFHYEDTTSPMDRVCKYEVLDLMIRVFRNVNVNKKWLRMINKHICRFYPNSLIAKNAISIKIHADQVQLLLEDYRDSVPSTNPQISPIDDIKVIRRYKFQPKITYPDDCTYSVSEGRCGVDVTVPRLFLSACPDFRQEKIKQERSLTTQAMDKYAGRSGLDVVTEIQSYLTV